MKTNQILIGVRLSIEGFHNFPKAEAIFGKEVSFLKERHRHIFHIDAKKTATHCDRDDEFILLKRKIYSYLLEKYGPDSSCIHYCEFGSMSCESIAQELLEEFNLTMCMVSEDNENYAQVINTTPLPLEEDPREVHFVIGRALSGKSTYVKKEATKDDIVIEVGDIVRNVTANKERVFDKDLDRIIVKNIFTKISESQNKTGKIYIVGCRQIEVLQSIERTLLLQPSPLKVFIHLIDRSFNEREQSFREAMELNKDFYLKNKDFYLKNKGLTLAEIDSKENELGFESLIGYLFLSRYIILKEVAI